MRRRIFSWLICIFAISLFSLYLGSSRLDLVHAADSVLSADDALKLAAAFINSDRAVSEKSFQDDIRMKESVGIYTLNDEICAYLFQLEDSDKSPSGYVIAGTSRRQLPIIEYAYDGECFLEKAKQYIAFQEELQQDDLDIYYTGGLNYFIGTANDKYIYRISSNGVDKIKRTEVNSSEQVEFNSDGIEEVNQLWNTWDSNIKENVKHLSKIKETIIFPDNEYHPVYESMKEAVVPDYDNVPYITIFDRNNQSLQQSGAISATNLLLYWYCQDEKKYSELLQKSWNNVFHTLYDEMETFQYSVTNPEDFYSTIKDYFKTNANGYKSLAYYSFNADWERVTSEIDSSNPAVIIFQEGIAQGKQYVLGLGYKEYNYNTKISRFILIEDGYGNEASRYVGYSSDYKKGGGMAVIRLRPY